MKLKKNDFLKIAVGSFVLSIIAPIVFTVSILNMYSCANTYNTNCAALNSAHWKVALGSVVIYLLWAIFISSLVMYLYRRVTKKP